MKKEKHVWQPQRIYYNFFGDEEHHSYEEYDECEICGAKRFKE